MIHGVHALLYAKDADRARAFFRDVLELGSIDAGEGWLIFELPPAELGIHPAEDEEYHELYLMCRDVEQAIADLERKGVVCAPIYEAEWGRVTSFELPGGGKMGMYQPKHPTSIDTPGARAKARKKASASVRSARARSAKKRKAVKQPAKGAKKSSAKSSPNRKGKAAAKKRR